MKEGNNIFKNPAMLTIALAIVIGGTSLGFGLRGNSTSISSPTLPVVAKPTVSISSEKVTTMVDLKALDRSFQELADQAAPAVVHIRTAGKETSNVFGGQQEVAGEGSGFIFRPDGYIVTNDHVVGGFSKVTVILHDGREFPGTVTRAEESDVAIVKIDAKDLPTLKFADSNQTRVGQLTMAIGAPFGLENTVTYGHVSATGRLNRIPDQFSGQVRNYFDMVQTDASINMGNSGGPLINVEGEVVGINTSIYSMTGQSNGIGFAISANTARTLAETLIQKGKVTRSYLGVAPENLKEYEAKQLKIGSGAILREVVSDGPGAAAGLQKGDVIIKINNKLIDRESDLRLMMFQLEPGNTVPVEYIRGSQTKTVDVKLTDAPKQVASNQGPSGGQRDFQMPGTPGLPDFKDLTPGQGRSTPFANGRAHLGVQVQDLGDSVRKQFTIPNEAKGAVVTMVEPGSIAEKLGIKSGDVIDQIGDVKIASSADVVGAVTAIRQGETRQINFARYSQSIVSRMSLPAVFK